MPTIEIFQRNKALIPVPTQYDGTAGDSPGDGSAVLIEADFDYTDVVAGSKKIGICPAGKTVFRASVIITEAFDGGATLEIGDSVGHARLMPVSVTQPEYIDTFRTTPDYKYETATDIYIYFPSGDSTAGEGKVIIYSM